MNVLADCDATTEIESAPESKAARHLSGSTVWESLLGNARAPGSRGGASSRPS